MILTAFKHVFNVEELKRGREQGREEGREEEEAQDEFIRAATGIVSEADLERIKERLRESQRH